MSDSFPGVCHVPDLPEYKRAMHKAIQARGALACLLLMLEGAAGDCEEVPKELEDCLLLGSRLDGCIGMCVQRLAETDEMEVN
jgi:hypothetical protein